MDLMSEKEGFVWAEIRQLDQHWQSSDLSCVRGWDLWKGVDVEGNNSRRFLRYAIPRIKQVRSLHALSHLAWIWVPAAWRPGTSCCFLNMYLTLTFTYWQWVATTPILNKVFLYLFSSNWQITF